MRGALLYCCRYGWDASGTYVMVTYGRVADRSGLAEHKAVNCMMKWNKCKNDQRSNDDEKPVNEVVNNVKIWTGGHGFTSGVSQVNKICM